MMGNASLRFRDFTIRPVEKPDVSLEPDGTIEVLFRDASLTLLLSSDEARGLAAAIVSLLLIGEVV